MFTENEDGDEAVVVDIETSLPGVCVVGAADGTVVGTGVLLGVG